MMTKPGITELDRCVDSRYTLVSVVAKRARLIGMERNNPDAIYNPKAEKPVTQAVNEIANGIVGYVRSEAIKKAREYEEEKFEALSQLHENKELHSEESNNTENASDKPEEVYGAVVADSAPGMFDDPNEDNSCSPIEAALADAQSDSEAESEEG